MASTTLFAPQVQSIQPAFVYYSESYTGEVKIYFSLSSYNDISEIGYIMFSIIDPNQVSGWGSNTMLKKEYFPLGYAAISKDEIQQDDFNKKYYIKIRFSSTYFKTFTKNQFYQVQLYFIDKNIDIDLNAIGNNLFLIDNNIFINKSQYISDPSQSTLIRPISNANIEVDGVDSDTNAIYNSNLQELRGRLKYDDGSTVEAISKYCIVIKKYPFGTEIIYKTPVTYNYSGINFYHKFKDLYLPEDNEYIIYFNYLTINGFEGRKEIYLNTTRENNVFEQIDKCLLKANSVNGSIEMELIFKNLLPKGTIIIQRSSYLSNFTLWEDIHICNINYDNEDEIETNIYKWADFSVESGVLYQYRILFKDIDNIIYTYTVETNKEDVLTNNRKPVMVTSSKEEGSVSISKMICSFEDIFLMDKTRYFSVRFDPNISSMKYVTQEAITNTLGGKYPIIRRNGDTKYRQFTISGLISFEGDKILLNQETDSQVNNVLSKWFDEECPSMLFGKEEFSKESSIYQYTFNDYYFEKRFRDLAIEFLTNGRVKLFKSETEGNILVYLSNISFTPNKGLSRMVYNFSATATECGEASIQNLIKYGIIDFESNIDRIYILKSEEIDDSGYYILNSEGYFINETTGEYSLLLTQEGVQVND